MKPALEQTQHSIWGRNIQSLKQIWSWNQKNSPMPKKKLNEQIKETHQRIHKFKSGIK